MAWTGTNLGQAHAASNVAVSVTVSAIPAGAMIFVSTGVAGPAGIGGVTDTAGNTYTLIASGNMNNVASNGNGAIFYVDPTTSKALASGNLITYTPGAGIGVTGVTITVSWWTFTGIGIGGVLDVSATPTTGNTRQPTITSGTPTKAGDLFIGSASLSASTNAMTQPAGWAAPPNGTSLVTPSIVTASLIEPALATHVYNPSYSGGPTRPWVAFLATFKTPVAVTNDGASHPEFLKAARVDGGDLVEVAAASRLDHAVRDEITLALRNDRTVTDELVTSRLIDRQVITEYMDAVRVDRPIPVESSAPVSTYDQPAALESAAGTSFDAVARAEAVTSSLFDAVAQFEKGVAVRADAASSLTALTTLLLDNQVALAILAESLIDQVVRAEALSALSSGSLAQVEFTASVPTVVADGAMAVEFVGALVRDVRSLLESTSASTRGETAPAEEAASVTSLRAFPTEFQGSTAIYDAKAVIETAGVIFRDAPSRVELIVSVRPEAVSQAEVLSSTSSVSDSAVQLENTLLTDVDGDGLVPFSILEGFQTDSAAPLEMFTLINFVTGNAVVNFEITVSVSLDSAMSTEMVRFALRQNRGPVYSTLREGLYTLGGF